MHVESYRHASNERSIPQWRTGRVLSLLSCDSSLGPAHLSLLLTLSLTACGSTQESTVDISGGGSAQNSGGTGGVDTDMKESNSTGGASLAVGGEGPAAGSGAASPLGPRGADGGGGAPSDGGGMGGDPYGAGGTGEASGGAASADERLAAIVNGLGCNPFAAARIMVGADGVDCGGGYESPYPVRRPESNECLVQALEMGRGAFYVYTGGGIDSHITHGIVVTSDGRKYTVGSDHTKYGDDPTESWRFLRNDCGLFSENQNWSLGGDYCDTTLEPIGDALCSADAPPADLTREVCPSDAEIAVSCDAGAETPVGAALGSLCSNSADCTGDAVCKIDLDRSEAICTRSCEATDCPSGFECVADLPTWDDSQSWSNQSPAALPWCLPVCESDTDCIGPQQFCEPAESETGAYCW